MEEIVNHAAPSHTAQGLDDILQILRAKLPELQERYGVRSLGVFGSYVRGAQHTESDLDLLVEEEADADPAAWLQAWHLRRPPDPGARLDPAPAQWLC